MAEVKAQANVNKLKQLEAQKKYFFPSAAIAPLACFLITAVVCWITGNIGQRTAIEQLYDSGHYMETCRQLVLFFHGLTGASTTCNLNKIIEYIMLDGPVLPIIASFTFLCFGQMPGANDWWLFSGLQCALQGLAAALVAMLAYELVGSKRWSFVAGLSWGLYPAAILATRTLMSETTNIVLMLLQVYLLCRLITGNHAAKQIGATIGAGFVSGLVLLTKPALFPSCAVVDLLGVFKLQGNRKRILALLAIGLGTVLSVLPWMIFTKTCVGQVYLTPQRLPVLNVVKGCDIEADGVGGFPYTITCNMYTEADGVLNIYSAIASAKPAELASLCVRKATRLFSLPWNDYRTKVFGVPATIQALAHRLIWLFALLGFLAVCAGIKAQSRIGTKVDKQNLFVGEACSLVILGHLAYLAFEAIPRYGFTAMPFVMILAVYFLHGLFARQTMWKEVAILGVSLLMVLISIDADVIAYTMMLTGDISNALWLGLIGRWLIIGWTFWLLWRITHRMVPEKPARIRLAVCLTAFIAISGVVLFSQQFHRAAVREWKTVLKDGMVATRELWLANQPKTKPAWALVLVDGDTNLSSAQIAVNGHKVTEKLESLYQFYPRKYQLINVIQLQAVTFGIKPERLRQWRAVPVPVEWLNLDGKNTVTIKPAVGQQATLYGDYPPIAGERSYLPSFEVFSHGKLWNSVDSLEGRIVSPFARAEVRSRNTLTKYGVGKVDDLSPSSGVQVGDYRLFIALGRCLDTAADHLTKKTHVADMYVDQLAIGANDLDAGGMKELSLDIPKTVSNSSHIQVDLTGDIMTEGTACPATAVLIAEAIDKKAPIILPGTPKVLYVNKAWAPLKVREILPSEAVEGGIGKLCLQMYIPPQYVANGKLLLRNLKLAVSSVTKPTLNKHWMGIY